MESSGSMQSSSGGDEEYDSRAESISAFLSHNTSNSNITNPFSHVGPMPKQPPPPQPPPTPLADHHHHHHHHPHHSSSSMFDPLSNYFDPLSSSPARSPPALTNPNSSLLNLDMVWPKSLRSEPSCTDIGGFMASSAPSPTQQFFASGFHPSVQIPHGPESAAAAPLPRASTGSLPNEQTSNNSNCTVRNPKKRSRASRRAPTTVLTTDTTNFRAMVQEFTGIPAPPFTSSPFPRSRLDLFGTASSLRSAGSHLDPSPTPYLLRPFAQKIQPQAPPPFLSSGSTSSSFSTSMADAIASATTTNLNSGASATNTTTSTSSTSIHYQLASDHLGFLKQQQQQQQAQNLLNINMQNPGVFNFHSLLQSPPKYPLAGSPILGATKPQQAAGCLENDAHLKVGVLEDFGLSHGSHVSTLQNMIPPPPSSSPDATAALRRTGDDRNNPADWPGGDAVGANEGDHHPHHDEGLLRSINGDYSTNPHRVTTNGNGKVRYTASTSSDFHRHGDKRMENVAAARSEGMVESWICSAD